jgi:uncharacterized phage protein (TIGR01671 family)
MKQILFRGKRVDNDEWVYGFLVEALNCVTDKNETFIIEQDATYFTYGEFACAVEVKPETVGQFTGLYDKNGKKIFEGDIIYIKCGYGLSAFVGKGIVFFDEKRLQFRVKSVEPSSFDSEKGNIYDECDFTVIDSYEVIGNINGNKEEE